MKKTYITPALRTIAAKTTEEIMAGSLWTGDVFTRKQEFEEEELDDDEDVTAPRGFWG